MRVDSAGSAASGNLKQLHYPPAPTFSTTTTTTTLCSQISFGGLPVSAKPNTGGRGNFVGCMEGITYNGENITNLVRKKKVDTSSFVRTLVSCPSDFQGRRSSERG